MDRYRLTAFDNRGAGRTSMPQGSVSMEMMADDAAAVLRALDVTSTHVAGFSGGSIIAQQLALRHPELAPAQDPAGTPDATPSTNPPAGAPTAGRAGSRGTQASTRGRTAT
jgi:pimeloyl-ACP methyl ester carboxylesterase